MSVGPHPTDKAGSPESAVRTQRGIAPKKWKRVLFLGLIVFPALWGVASLMMWITSEGAVSTIRSHLDAVNKGDYTLAYSYLSPALQKVLSMQQFRALLEEKGEALKAREATFPVRHVRWGGTMELELSFYLHHKPDIFEKCSEDFDEKFLEESLHRLDNAAQICGILTRQGGKRTAVHYFMIEETDVASGKRRWAIYGFHFQGD